MPRKVRKFDLDSFRDSLGLGERSQSYARGEAIFRQGDSAGAVFYIRKGKVQISVVSDQGKEGVIGILESGEFFGEGCLAGQALYMATASALTDTAAVRIDKAAMIRVLRERADFSHLFMAFLLARNVQIEADLVDRLFNSSEKRLARVLLLLAHFGKDGQMELVIPQINQEILAARVGTTRSRINYFMNKFRKLGFIEYQGTLNTLKVHSSLLNVVVHE